MTTHNLTNTNLKDNATQPTTEEIVPTLQGNDLIELLSERTAKRGYPILSTDTQEVEGVTYLKFLKTRDNDTDFIWVGMKGDNVVYLPEEIEQAANMPGEPSGAVKQSAATASNKQDKAQRNAQKQEAREEQQDEQE